MILLIYLYKKKFLSSISLNTELEVEAQGQVYTDLQEFISQHSNEKQ